MGQQTRITTDLTPEDRNRLFGWGNDIFDVQHLLLEWRAKDWHLIIDEDGQAVSHVGILTHIVTVNSISILVGGIGGVVTIPEKQGQGYGQIVLQQARNYLCHELQVSFGILFCLSHLKPFYARIGWQPLENHFLIAQSTGKQHLPAALNPMMLPCGTMLWPAGEIDLASPPW